MTIRFTTLPPSTNHMYGGKGRARYLLPAVRTAKEAIAWEARAQYRGKPLTGPLAIEMTIFWPDRRRHDWDNNKAFFDALNGIVYEDDNQIKDGRVIVEYDAADPRVELWLWELDPTPVSASAGSATRAPRRRSRTA